MKRFLILSCLFAMISFAATAQRTINGQSPRPPRNNQLTRYEKIELRKDALRYQMLRRRAQRDGVVTPFERRKLRKAKCETRRDLFRFRHNGRRQLI